MTQFLYFFAVTSNKKGKTVKTVRNQNRRIFRPGSAKAQGIAREMVAGLREEGADVIVMLSNLSEGENRRLAESVSGIHAIIGRGVSEKEEVQLDYVQGLEGWTTALAWGGARSKFLGKLVLAVKDGLLLYDRTSWRLLNVSSKILPNSLKYSDICSSCFL